MEERTNTAKCERTRPGIELEPETILPSQFSGGATLDSSLQPEKRLMLAVLEEAVGTYQKYSHVRDRTGHRLFEDAADWFWSDATAWPFSFVNVCNALGLDVDYFRAGLDRWRAQQSLQESGKVLRFPFRRVNGARHSITGRAPGLRQSA